MAQALAKGTAQSSTHQTRGLESQLLAKAAHGLDTCAGSSQELAVDPAAVPLWLGSFEVQRLQLPSPTVGLALARRAPVRSQAKN